MADIYLETPSLNHNFEEYSYEKVLAELDLLDHANEQKGASVTDARDKANYINTQKQIKEYHGLLEKYHDEFPVLYRIYQHGLEGEDGKSVNYAFKPIDFRKPEVITEEQDIEDKDSQLELECTFQDGLKFAVSAVKYNGSEDKLFAGQISLDDDTIEKLNAENLKRIMDFCERCGFSTFGLTIPTQNGVVDADEKIKELNKLLQDYQQEKLALSKNEAELKEIGRDEDGLPEYEDKNMRIIHDGDEEEHNPDAKKQEITLEDILKNFRTFLKEDLHKKSGLSYWEHSCRVGGQRMTLFNIFDKEDPEQDDKDGQVDPKKPHTHVQLFSYRLYVGQRKDGKFIFGYSTPTGKKMDDVMAGDLIGQIKKTGVTHVNLKNIPSNEKVIWMIACAEKGLIPTGVTIDESKALRMIEAAEKKKLPPLEMAAFKRRLAEQLEKNAAKKGKDLPPNEAALVQQLKNDAQKLIETAEDKTNTAKFEEKFHNFRKVYNDDLKKEAEKTIARGVMDTNTGAADAIGAMSALTRTFDMALGDASNMEVTFAERLEELIQNPIKNKSTGNIISVRLTEHEKRSLLMNISPEKKIKDLTSDDWKHVYNVMFERAYKEAKDKIINEYRKDEASRAHAIDNIIINKVWKRETTAFDDVNNRLSAKGVEELKLPKKDGELLYQRPKELTFAYVQEQEKKKKAAEEAAKAAGAPTPTPTPEKGRGGM